MSYKVSRVEFRLAPGGRPARTPSPTRVMPAQTLDPLSAAAGGSADDQSGTIRNWKLPDGKPAEIDAEPAAVLDGLGRRDPYKADRVRAALRQFPPVGGRLAGFRLVALLGKGAFGRVYLAQQDELADRYVALKVSADLSGETRTLAQLQHTNIVPVYSAHHAGPLQAVCMPYLGPITLGSLLDKCRQRNTLPLTGRELVTTLHGLNADTGLNVSLPSHRPSTQVVDPSLAPASEAAGRLPARPQAVLKLLDGLSYLDAVCWIGGRLADALAHAHDRGIVHNDLKPANVLLADDGQPMLLDFGVSDDLKLRAAVPDAPVGGTLPYMSPEQLEAVQGGTWAPDPRSDVYALGVILYELLTAAHPFRRPAGGLAREVSLMTAERRAGPPPLRTRNPAVTPGLEAIVRKALEPDPARRYQSAADLRDDLDRHRTHQPLLHVRVPSVRERLRKWGRRHPRLSSTATVSALAATVVLGCGAALYQRANRIERYEAETAMRESAADLQAARNNLINRAPAPDMVAAGVVRARAALDRYAALTADDWERRPPAAALTADERARLRQELSEACLLLARGCLLQAGPGDRERLAEAMGLNQRAERLADGAAPRAVWVQRAELHDRLADPAAAAADRDRAGAVPVVTARDHYLLGRQAHLDGRPREALAHLDRATALDPALFWAHLTQARCWEDVGNYSQARASYTTALALWPDFPWVSFNRGLVGLRLGDFARAKSDFDRVIDLDPQLTDAYLNRALAHQGLKQYAAGIADLDRADELGASTVRVCFMRARLRELAGDPAGAKRDIDAGLKDAPTDEAGWVARGVARMRTDPAAAATDFAAARGLNPRSLAALQNHAYVLGRLGRNADAAEALGRAVELFPDFVPSRAGRGVMAARLGDWAAAEADAKESLRRDASPAIVYQAAGIYALLSKHDPKHKPEALRLLTQALRAGFGFEHLESDKELDPLRDDPEFQKVIAGARALKPAKAGS